MRLPLASVAVPQDPEEAPRYPPLRAAYRISEEGGLSRVFQTPGTRKIAV